MVDHNQAHLSFSLNPQAADTDIVSCMQAAGASHAAQRFRATRRPLNFSEQLAMPMADLPPGLYFLEVAGQKLR